MPDYPFELVRYDRNTPLPQFEELLRERPFSITGNSFAEDARRFVPGKALETAINTAIAVDEPLLITGKAGTGKTQAAYYAAYKLGIEPVIHIFNVQKAISTLPPGYRPDMLPSCNILPIMQYMN